MPQEYRPTTPAPDSIGFRELRLACEISTLREDLERIAQGTDALKEHIEEVVEEVRQRFSNLTAEELADAQQMLPLLQFAVSQLVSIRESARQTDTASGVLADESRAYWDATDARPQAPAPPPPAPPRADPPMPPMPPRIDPPAPPVDLWTAPADTRPPRPSAPAPAPRPSRPSESIDWLSPPPRSR